MKVFLIRMLNWQIYIDHETFRYFEMFRVVFSLAEKSEIKSALMI